MQPAAGGGHGAAGPLPAARQPEAAGPGGQGPPAVCTHGGRRRAAVRPGRRLHRHPRLEGAGIAVQVHKANELRGDVSRTPAAGNLRLRGLAPACRRLSNIRRLSHARLLRCDGGENYVICPAWKTSWTAPHCRTQLQSLQHRVTTGGLVASAGAVHGGGGGRRRGRGHGAAAAGRLPPWRRRRPAVRLPISSASRPNLRTA